MEHGRRVLRANSSSELTARSTWRARSWSVGSRLEPSQYVLSFAMERIIYKWCMKGFGGLWRQCRGRIRKCLKVFIQPSSLAKFSQTQNKPPKKREGAQEFCRGLKELSPLPVSDEGSLKMQNMSRAVSVRAHSSSLLHFIYSCPWQVQKFCC